MQPIVLLVGTRPEGIKMAPVYWALKEAQLPVFFCSTMQHDELLTQVLELFDITPDAHLQIMRLQQDLFYVTQSILQKTKDLFMRINPQLVLVQGDTTTVMAGSLAAFYLGIPVAHVEAGLRTGDLSAPFPEEFNRQMVSLLARYHFAPTQLAVEHLRAVQVPDNRIFNTGNTVVDALRIITERIASKQISIRSDLVRYITEGKKQNKKILLLTAHRRESFNGGIERILQTVKRFVHEENVFCFYPFHPNPAVLGAIEKVGLTNEQNFYVCEPLTYPDLVYLQQQADLIVTDSGGIQEEAISLGKPVIVLREKTERMEGVHAGLAQLVGTDQEAIYSALEQILTKKPSASTSLYGDGYAAQKIVEILKSNHTSTQKKIGAVKTPQYSKKEYALVKKSLCVVGLGYIGLPTAIVAADHGLQVTGFDIDMQRVQAINRGDPLIQEPELFEQLQLMLSAQTFRALIDIEPADYFIIAVPTPFKEGKKANLSHVFAAVKTVTTVVKKGDTIILESTVPVGTTQQMVQLVEKETGLKVGTDIFVAYSPERVLPGRIFHELIHNDRVVGADDAQSIKKACELYTYFVEGEIHKTNTQTAEMVKLVENSSRDVQLAFANQVGSMSYQAGLNPYEIIELANKHPRVQILQPGCGVGGHCIAVDPWFLVESFPDDAQFIRSARITNDNKPYEVIRFIEQSIAKISVKKQKKPTVLLLGLTYKADVDDVRESPALLIAQTMIKDAQVEVKVAEPHVNKQRLKELVGDHGIEVSDGLACADIVVFLVGHRRFKAIDKKTLQAKRVLDFCGVLYQSIPTQSMRFWPASSTIDFFIANQNIPETSDQEPTS